LTATARFRSLLWPTFAALVAFVILCGLGVWQVQRLHWKEALIARVNTRLDAAPVPAPASSRGRHRRLSADAASRGFRHWRALPRRPPSTPA